MISSIVSRLVILVFGTLYPAYASYKAVRTKNVKEYVKWMMYWIVFALFTCAETFTDVFLSFWFPFYYEIKIILVLWLLSPATKGSSILYRKFVHPMLSRREQEIDEYIAKAKEQGYHTVLHLGSKGVNYATTVLMQTAIKGGGGLVNQLRKSYSLSDLSSDKDSDLNRNSKALKNVQDDDELEEETDGAMDPRMLRSRGYSPRRSASGSGRVEMYFPEVDVDVRQRGASRPRDPSIPLSHIRSTEDVSSGYSSAEPLYAGHPATKSEGLSASREPLVRTASVGSTRSMRTKSSRGGVVAKRGPAAEDNELVDEGDEAESSKREEYFYDIAPSLPSQTSVPILSPAYTSAHSITQKKSDTHEEKENIIFIDTEVSVVSAPDEELPLYDAETDVSEVQNSDSLELTISSVLSYDDTTVSIATTEIIVEHEADKLKINSAVSSETCLQETEVQNSQRSVLDAVNTVSPSPSANITDLETNLKSLENSCSKVLETAECKLPDQTHATSDDTACNIESETKKEQILTNNEDCIENKELQETSITVNSISEPAIATSPLTSLSESSIGNTEEGNKMNEQVTSAELENSCSKVLEAAESKLPDQTHATSDDTACNSENETKKEQILTNNEDCIENKELQETSITVNSISEPSIATSPLTSLSESSIGNTEEGNKMNEQVTSAPLNENNMESLCNTSQNLEEIKETTAIISDKNTEGTENINLVDESNSSLNNVNIEAKVTEIDEKVVAGSEKIQAVKAEFEVITSIINGIDKGIKEKQEANENGSTYGSVESLSPDEMPKRSLSQSSMQRAGRYNKAPAPAPPPRKSESEPEIWTDTSENLSLEPPKDAEKSRSTSASPSPTLTVKKMPLEKETTENEDSVSPESSVTTARLVLKPGVVRTLGPDSENKSEVFVSKQSQNKGRKYKSKQKQGESSFSKLFAFPKASSLTSLIPFWHGNKQSTASTQQPSPSTASVPTEQTGNTSVYISLHEEPPGQKRTSDHDLNRSQELDGAISNYSHMARTPVQSRKAPLAKVE